MNNVCIFSPARLCDTNDGRHALKPMHAPHGMSLGQKCCSKKNMSETRPHKLGPCNETKVPGISLETLHYTASRRWFVADPAAKQGKPSRARSRGDGFNPQPIGRQRLRTASPMARHTGIGHSPLMAERFSPCRGPPCPLLLPPAPSPASPSAPTAPSPASPPP